MNYTQLSDAIVAYTENTSTEFAAQISVFVKQAEQRIYNSVQCPSDFLAVYSMAAIDASGNYEYLLNKDVNFIRQSYPNPNDDKAIPRYYALFGPQSAHEDELVFLLGPTPDATYTIELHYFYYPESITVAADGRTWLGDNLDAVLLYGSLVEAYTYMKGETDMMALYNGKYNEALQLARRLGDGLERSDAYRSGQFRAPPLPQISGVK